VALIEVKSLAKTLEVLLAEIAELLTDNCEGYMPFIALAPTIEPALKGSLFTKSIVDAYIVAVIELWRL
jgi:hypothetical protein